MDLDIKKSTNLNSPSRDRELLKQVHPERIPNVSDISMSSKIVKPPCDVNEASGMSNHYTNRSAAEKSSETTPADVLMKKQAFSSDLGLPLSPKNGYTVKIHSLVGDEPIPSEYTNVVADGESIWLELPEKAINKTSFRRRQLTSSRQYWTFNGVTLHQQLQLETGRIPRRHKLAVRCIRNEPSSRLQTGRWYIHVHQIKIQLPSDNPRVRRKLHTAKLIRSLRSTFGPLYHPRTRQTRELPSYWKHKTDKNGNVGMAGEGIMKEQVHIKTNQPSNLNTTETPRPISSFFPWPMQAPQPWVNPYYYTGQTPPANIIPLQNLPTWTQVPAIQTAFNQTASSPFYHALGGVPVQGAKTNQHLTQAASASKPFFGSRRAVTDTGNVKGNRA